MGKAQTVVYDVPAARTVAAMMYIESLTCMRRNYDFHSPFLTLSQTSAMMSAAFRQSSMVR